MVKTCALFDFDGVIADTERGNSEYAAKVLARHGVVLTEEDKLSFVGINTRAVFELFLHKIRKPISVDELLEERFSLGTTYEDGALKLMPGVTELIKGLRGTGLITGVVSSTSARLVLAALNRLHMTTLFDVIVGGDMAKRFKPAPDIYQKAMEYAGVYPEQCIAIEDSPSGIQSAKAAGIYVFGFTGGEIKQNVSEADSIIDDFRTCINLPQWRQWGIQGNQ